MYFPVEITEETLATLVGTRNGLPLGIKLYATVSSSDFLSKDQTCELKHLSEKLSRFVAVFT